MDTTTKRRKKVTIQDFLNEVELELLGVTESVDGSPVNSSRKRSEFLEDCGMWEDPVLLEIRSRYKGKLRDKVERKKYHREAFAFIKEYFNKKVDEAVFKS